MSTSLFDRVIFGPIRSRRLGISLGVNLLHPTAKLCNFDCIYCECGWNSDNPHGRFNPRSEVLEALELKLQEMAAEGELPNFITFAGNGEPTMHPEFEAVIDGTIALRDSFAPDAKIGVLTNATMIDRESVRSALKRVDKAMLKFDSAVDSTVRLVNQPNGRRTVGQTVELMKLFDGEFVMQTMFLRGRYGGCAFDNTTEGELDAWLAVVDELRPQEVMLYSIDRDTPHFDLQRVSREELLDIASRVEALGITTSVS